MNPFGALSAMAHLPWSRLAVVLLAVVSAMPLGAQGGFRSHNVGFGITLSLPGDWVADTDASLTSVREASLAWLRSSGDARLRGVAGVNENALLFRAHDSTQPTNSTNLNVTVGDSDPDVFARATDTEVGAMVAEICGVFEAQLREVSGAGGCTSHELITLENRRILVIYQSALVPAASLDNRRVVAMFPSSGLLFTLSLSLRGATYDPATVRAVLASVRFPEGL